MKHTNAKNIQNAFQRYLESTAFELSDVYGSYSGGKACGMRYCKELSNKLNGARPRILSYNIFMFTVGFTAEYQGKDVFVYITPNYEYYCYLDELR